MGIESETKLQPERRSRPSTSGGRAARFAGALALALLLSACAPAEAPAPAETEQPALTAATEPTAEAAPTPPAETEMPIEEEPAPTELEEAFFDDALFIGDSLTGSLQTYVMKSGGLGKAKIVFVNGLACHNIVLKNQRIVYAGQALSPAQTAAKAGAKRLFLLLAANDVGTRTVEELRSCWDTMIAEIRELNPEVTVYVQSGTPFRGDVNYFTKENMDDYNDMLREMCEANGCVFVDITEGLLTEDGYLDDSFRVDIEDNVHMNQAGCAIWVQNLRDPDSYSVPPLH